MSEPNQNLPTEPKTAKPNDSNVQPKKTLHDIISPSDQQQQDPTEDKSFDIPKFNLTEDLLNEYRKKITSRRRKSQAQRPLPRAAKKQPPIPIKEIAPPKHSQPEVAKRSEQTSGIRSEPLAHEIIKDIVERDIKMLCGS
jgi:hypothetical protein